jgi:hypothetical protein
MSLPSACRLPLWPGPAPRRGTATVPRNRGPATGQGRDTPEHNFFPQIDQIRCISSPQCHCVPPIAQRPSVIPPWPHMPLAHHGTPRDTAHVRFCPQRPRPGLQNGPGTSGGSRSVQMPLLALLLAVGRGFWRRGSETVSDRLRPFGTAREIQSV